MLYLCDIHYEHGGKLTTKNKKLSNPPRNGPSSPDIFPGYASTTAEHDSKRREQAIEQRIRRGQLATRWQLKISDINNQYHYQYQARSRET